MDVMVHLSIIHNANSPLKAIFFKIDGISKIGLETVYEAHYQAILTYIIT